MVLASEIAVDVVKHAFITKFNDISADVSSLLISVGRFIPKDKSTLGLGSKYVSSSFAVFRDLSFVIQQKQPHTKEWTLLSLNCQTSAHQPYSPSDCVCKFTLFITAGVKIQLGQFPSALRRRKVEQRLFSCLSDSAMADACVTVQVYGEYKASLAFDLVSSRQKNVSETVLQTTVCTVWRRFDSQTISTHTGWKVSCTDWFYMLGFDLI